jgi:enoyl-CoA hydratase/carnithine racemase
VTLDVDDSVATLTLDDPAKGNALSEQMARELFAAVRELDADPALRVGIITGAGTTFCSGADLSDPTVHSTERVTDYVPRRRTTIFQAVARCTKPLIAAINGPAVGAGANLALACDMRICGTDAWIQWPQARLGVLPGSGTLVRLTAVAGVSRAMEWTLTGAKISATVGEQAGLFNRTAPQDELLAGARSLAAAICESAPLSVRFIRESLSQLVNFQAQATADADEYRSFILFNTRERKQASDVWNKSNTDRNAAQER